MAKAKWPTRWLMSDERMGDALLPAIARMPAGGGIVLRHHALGPEARWALGREVAALARTRGLVLAVARDVALAKALDAALVHNPEKSSTLPFSRSVHSVGEARAARGAALAFVSPILPTRSHPGAPALPADDIRAILAELDCPAIALGGMNDERFEEVRPLGFAGWAGIDAWL